MIVEQNDNFLDGEITGIAEPNNHIFFSAVLKHRDTIPKDDNFFDDDVTELKN